MAGHIVISDDSDIDIISTKPASKKKAKSTTVSPAKSKKASTSNKQDDSDSDMADFKPETSKKRKAKAVASSSSSSESEQDKPKKKKTAASSSKKQPAAKKQKVQDDQEEDKPKPKWSYKPRAGPANPGSKDVPVGDDNCLAGLTIVFTGELESLSREDAQQLAKRYGARVTTSPSSKTSYVVVGADAGPKKLEMIKKHGIKMLTEDEFLDMIGSRKAKPDDPKVKEMREKEEKKIKEVAKSLETPKGSQSDLTHSLWTVKYAPTSIKDICGNKGHVEKLKNWLENWPKSLASDFKKGGADGMGAFRAVLISGPPGIGKTTAAHLVANVLGYNVLELNASDTRSKKLLETAFSSTIDNATLSGFVKSKGDAASLANPGVNTKSVIIMDEVDGLSGSDRGGVGALNVLIKKTKVPIIAICNDKQNPKMKPLVHTCFQMIFKRPTSQEIRARIMSICYREGLKIDGKTVDQLVEGSRADIRQIINMISTWKLGAGSMDFDEGQKLVKLNEKNSVQTGWTLYSSLSGPQAFARNSKETLTSRLELYFTDFSLLPLFVHENYLKNRFSRSRDLQGADRDLKNIELAAKAAEAISDGDLVDSCIHTQQQWSLMPTHGVFSCVRPASFTYGQSSSWPSFPAWFGKNSTQGKLQRMLGEVQIHMRLKVSGDRREIRQQYIPTLLPKLVEPLIEEGATAVDQVVATMDDYYLTKEDWDAILEMGIGPDTNGEALLKKIPSAVKSAFTRSYNKVDHPVAFYKATAGKPKKVAGAGPAPDLEDVILDDQVEEEEDDAAGSGSGDDDITKDKLIVNKAKKGKGAGEKAKAAAKKAPAKKVKKEK